METQQELIQYLDDEIKRIENLQKYHQLTGDMHEKPPSEIHNLKLLEEIRKHLVEISNVDGLRKSIEDRAFKMIQQHIDRNLDEWIAALGTQYQIRSDAIVGRKCDDAPTPLQLATIREAHNYVRCILIAYKKARDGKTN